MLARHARLLPLVLLLAATGCSAKPKARQPRVPVAVARAEQRTMPFALVSTGTVEAIRTAAVGSQVGGVITRVGFREGDEVTFFYDPMIAKVIAHGPTRDAAIGRMIDALDAIEIEGLAANVAFLRATMRHSEFRAGNVFTGFVDRFKADLVRV